jgi:anti-anti-sigma factor
MFTHRFSVRVELRRNHDRLMSLKVTSSGWVAVIAVSGEVDVCNGHLLSELAERVLRDDPLRLVVDLANVTFFGAAGIHALLRIRAAVNAGAGQLILLNPSRITVTALTATGDIDKFSTTTTTIGSSTSTTAPLFEAVAKDRG